MTDQELAQTILTNLRKRRGTDGERKLSIQDIVFLKQIAKEKEDEPEVPSNSVCGSYSLGSWCFRCEEQPYCKLYHPEL